MLCDLMPGKKVLISIRSHGIGLTSAMLDGKLRTWNSYTKHLSSLKLKISLFWIAQCAGCHQHGRSYLPCDGIVQRAYSLLESWMANFFFEMRLHWFMVVVFITLDWIFVLMNITPMILRRRASYRKLVIPLWISLGKMMAQPAMASWFDRATSVTRGARLNTWNSITKQGMFSWVS